MRSISRVCDVSINTVTKLLIDAGRACADFHDNAVRNVKAQRIQCDEIWSFSCAKARNVKMAKAAPDAAGDVWTWTAIDADSKLIVSWHVGDRTTQTGISFISDLRARLANKVQLTTDGHRAYVTAVKEANLDADYAMLIKIFAEDRNTKFSRYSPPHIIGTEMEVIRGNPDPAHVSTSFAERQNLTMRMQMRRFTRLTNAFSKKFENHCHALALYFFWYNWTRQHKAHRLSPAMAAGLTDNLLSMSDLAEMVDAAQHKPGKRGPYKKQIAA
jgi:IS1 family transposase